MSKKAELEAKMAQPEFYQDPEQIRQINLEYHKLTAELEIITNNGKRLLMQSK